MKMSRLFPLLLTLVLLASVFAGCGSCDHQWMEADCQRPKTCKLCGETDGQPTDKHQWEEATTDAPKTCSVCHLTEGDPIDVDERFTTSACKPLFGQWQTTYETDGTSLGMSELVIPMKMTVTFCKDGELLVETAPQSISALEQEVAQRLAQMLYDHYSSTGLNWEQADAACKEQSGKSVTEFCAYRANQIVKTISSQEEHVYYVEDGSLFTGEDWGDDMSPRTFELSDNGKLLLEANEPEQTVEFTRMATVTN